MRGNAHVTGLQPPRTAQREWPAGPALSGTGRWGGGADGGSRPRCSWKLLPGPRRLRFGHPLPLRYGEHKFPAGPSPKRLRAIQTAPRRHCGRGACGLPGVAGGGPRGQRPHRPVDTCQPIHGPTSDTAWQQALHQHHTQPHMQLAPTAVRALRRQLSSQRVGSFP